MLNASGEVLCGSLLAFWKDFGNVYPNLGPLDPEDNRSTENAVGERDPPQRHLQQTATQAIPDL